MERKRKKRKHVNRFEDIDLRTRQVKKDQSEMRKRKTRKKGVPVGNGDDCPKCGAKGSVEKMVAEDVDTFYTCQECGATKLKSTGKWM